MRVNTIGLDTLTTHGKARIRYENDAASLISDHSIPPVSYNLYGNSFKRHYAALPGQYRLPFRLDMAVQLDYPSFILLAGDGHISFASPWQNNRKIEDIAFPSGKPNPFKSNFYNDSIPMNAWVDISITYNVDEMQILINGEERFYTRNFAYMKKKNRDAFKALNADGFSIKLAVTKLSTLRIKSINITEYDESAPIVRGAFDINSMPPVTPKEKPTFESVIATLPQEYQDEVIKTHDFLKTLRPMKFKRVIDKNGGKISWIASDYGISYHIEPSGQHLSQRFGWYIITAGKPDTWHQKCDHLEEVLQYISQTDPQLAERIFYAINDCVACYGSRCMVKIPYAFNGQKRVACHGTIKLRMSHDDFNDVRAFFTYLNALMQEKMAN